MGDESIPSSKSIYKSEPQSSGFPFFTLTEYLLSSLINPFGL